MFVNKFIASDFQVDTRDSYGNTMLHYAVVADNAKMEKLITETYGANPTLVNNAKQTPADVKKQLLDAGADINWVRKVHGCNEPLADFC